MTDIVLGIRLKAMDDGLVGTVKGSTEAVKGLGTAAAGATSEAAKLNAEHQNMARTMSASSAEADKFVARLRLEAETLGMTTLQTKAYAASKIALNDAQARSVAASLTAIRMHEDERASAEKAYATITMLGKAFAVYAAARVAATIVSVKSVLAEADDLNKESQALGVAVEWLNKMRYSGDLANVSNDQLRLGLRNLTQQIKEAESQTGNGGRIFNAMGVAVTDVAGRVRTLDNLLPELADRFASYADGPRKTALALELFGRDGLRWVPLLSQGAAGLAQNAEELQKLGAVIGGDLSAKAENFRDNLTRIDAASKAMKIEIAEGVIPTLSSMIEKFVQARREGDGLVSSLWAGLRGGVSEKQSAMRDLVEGTQTRMGLENEIARLKNLSGPYRAGAARQLAARETELAAANTKIDLANSYLDSFKPPPSVLTGDAPIILKPPKSGGSGVQNPYESMARQLDQEALRLAGEMNSTQKLENDLLHMGAAARAKMTAAEVESLRVKAAANDAKVLETKALDDLAKATDAYNKIRETGAAANAGFFMAASQQAKALEDEAKAYGMTTRERDLYIESAKLDRQHTEALTKAGKENLDVQRQINKEYDARKAALPGLIAARAEAREAEAAQKASLEEFKNLWSTVESTGKQVFVSLFSHGDDTFKNLGKSLKASLIDLLYQLTARKWIINIGTSVAGSLGLGTAATAANAASGGGGGGIGDLLGLGNSVSNLFGGSGMFGGAVNLAGNTLAGASWLGTGSMFGSVGGAELAGLAALEGGGALAGGAAAGAGIASAIPYIGWAIAAYSLLSGGFGGGGTPAVLTSKDMPAGMVGYGAGLTGDVYGNDSNQGYRWVGEHAQNIWATEINGLYDEIAKLGTQLGYDTSNIRNLTATVSSQIPAGSDYGAAFPGIMAQVSDQIARQLIPNLDALAQAGESATQTLARLAVELQQAKLGEIFTLMGGAIALQDQTRDLWLSDLSPFTATERFNASNAKYAELLGKAPSDARAMAELGAFTRSNLSEAASYYGTSTPEYRALFEGRQADVGNLVTDTLTEQSIQFAEMGLTMKDIAANTKDLDTRIAAALQSAIDAWQAAQAVVATANTQQIVQAVNSTAQQTAFVLASAASAEMNRGLLEDRASGDE